MAINWELLVATAVAALSGMWAVFQWSQQRQREVEARVRERREQEERISSRYVMPFLIAAEELQSRLYNVLEREGLGPFRRRYPDGRHAEETLYLVAQYFAFEPFLYRYTAYGSDQEAIRLLRAVRSAFATTDIPVGPWTVFRPMQQGLGKLVVDLVGDEPHAIGLWAFTERLATLGDDPVIAESLDVLREATSVTDLTDATRWRLGTVQQRVVDVVEYFEVSESARRDAAFTLFDGTRGRAQQPQRV
jgi:hypothetical protein